MEALTHRRTESELTDDCVILFATQGNEHYGDHVWTLRTELPSAESMLDQLVAAARELYTEAADEELVELVNPSDIVDSAGAWDDPQYWEVVSTHIRDFVGVRTCDGAVVYDRDEVELDYHCDDA